MGGWRKLHNKDLCDLYSSPRIIVEDEVGGALDANWGVEEHVKAIGKKAREKETTRKTETYVSG
jgi:hypothetical protein